MDQENQNRQENEYYDIRLTKYSIEYLRRTATWLKLASVLGFISSGFIILGAFFSLGASGIMKGIKVNEDEFIVLFIVYLIISVLIFIPSRYLLFYSRNIRDFIKSKDDSQIENAFLMQKKYWTYIGNTTLICLTTIIISLVLFVLGDFFLTQSGAIQ